MNSTNFILGISIHIIIPLIGLLFYLRLVWKMKKEEVDAPPTIQLFVLFATYGGLLLLTLTALFWKWSGMASLGAFYIILVAPTIMAYIAVRNYNSKEKSVYHLSTYRAALWYFGITPLTILLLILFE